LHKSIFSAFIGLATAVFLDEIFYYETGI